MKVLGYTMLGLLFAGLYILLGVQHGFLFSNQVFFGTAMLSAWTIYAVHLISRS